jgi:hypothetical protein
LVVAVDIKSTGEIDGYEVIQPCARDLYANIIPLYRRLPAVDNVFIFAGE